MRTRENKPGNRLYVWVAERPVAVAFAALALGFVAAFVAVSGILQTRSEVHDVGSRITKIESPCLRASEEPTRLNKKQCRESFEKAVLTITHAQACAIERKAGMPKAIRELAAELNVAFSEPCAGARLAQEKRRSDERAASALTGDGGTETAPTSSGGGGGEQTPANPNTGGSVGPGKGGGSGGAPVPGSGGNSGESPTTEPPGSGGPSQGTAETSPPESSTGSSAGSLPGTVEAVGKAGGEVVGKAGGAVEGAGHGVNCLLDGGC